ncbi:MAG: transposase [Rhodospirillales bacterium]|nr:transposase [Rhodospirillales bacterium]
MRAARREAVVHLYRSHEVSQRRACSMIGVERSSIRYRSKRPDDGPIRARLRALAAQRRRFGYRRLHVLLGREGIPLNHKKLRRLYREERLQVRRRVGRKRALGPRTPMTLPRGPNQRWSLDFVSDAFIDSRRFRILADTLARAEDKYAVMDVLERAARMPNGGALHFRLARAYLADEQWRNAVKSARNAVEKGPVE